MKTCRLGLHQWKFIAEEGMLYGSTKLLPDISDLYKYNSSKVASLKLVKGKKK